MRIAEESRRIADESKKVANLTRRDSTDMRVIAAVTLIFLPGTFTAVSLLDRLASPEVVDSFQTFFSTTFFDFLGPGVRYSSLGLGLYWAVTIALTLVVLVGWIKVSRIQSAKDGELFLSSN